jgi:hypothetical protein
MCAEDRDDEMEGFWMMINKSAKACALQTQVWKSRAGAEVLRWKRIVRNVMDNLWSGSLERTTLYSDSRGHDHHAEINRR